MTTHDEKQQQIHNQLAGPIVSAIVHPPLGAGGEVKDVLVLLESVILGVYSVCVKLGGDVPVWSAMSERIEERLAEMRLGDVLPKGKA